MEHDSGQNEFCEIEKTFETVLEAEHVAIRKRRSHHHHNDKIERFAPQQKAGSRPVFDTTGVALSGGGIRSAAYCLGVLQALGAWSLIECVDYLSTVSGGGYVGSAMTACMAKPDSENQQFPFSAPFEFKDRDAVGHLRDYSNYLLPRGGRSLPDIISVLLRGWATNLVFVLGVVLFPAWLMVVAFSNRTSLDSGQNLIVNVFQHALWSLGIHAENLLISIATFLARFGIAGTFGFTICVLWSLAIVLLAWATIPPLLNKAVSDVKGPFIRVSRVILVLLAGTAFVEAQPLIVAEFWYLHDLLENQPTEPIKFGAGAFSAVIVFFRDRLSGFLKTSESQSGLAIFLQRVAVKASIWIAALVIPLAVYSFFLWLCAAAMHDKAGHAFNLSRDGMVALPGFGRMHVQWAYFLTWIFFFSLLSVFAPNANSLHRLYRDKLSKAFLFDPDPKNRVGEDLKERDDLKLSDISPETGGPYHLINAALNLQNSKYANRRGRDATFFLFSSEYVGSDVTGYVATSAIEDDDTHLNLGTAMAISGAAVSANMGSYTISALAPTLALLNVRLGYWLVNPRAVKAKSGTPTEKLVPAGERIGTLHRWLSRFLKYYLVSEITGNLNEGNPHIYVTDGGHIENLGLYELLKRGCRAIIVVDAEADPTLSFTALATAERYARIDLGVRIDLPWEQIARGDFNAPTPIPDGSVKRPDALRHCALGIIEYPNDKKGLLLYVKASATGDEPDYVLNYKARNPAFPHESTGDQFFSEEQFEAYRALGFHALQTFFEGKFIWGADSDWQEFRTADPSTRKPPATKIDAAELKQCFLNLLKRGV